MSPEYEKRRDYYRQRYLANRERILAQMKVYQAENPEVTKKAQRKYQERHAEKLRQRRRDRYSANPQRDYESHRRWVRKNTFARMEYMRHWRIEQADHRKSYDAAYRQVHKEQRAERQNARRARQIGNGGSHTRAQWLALKDAYANCCGYCSVGGVRLTKDHAIPLARGGGDDISNIIPACLPCNRRKHVKTAEEFMRVLWASRSE